MHINPYLGFDGSCEEAFRFYEKVLNGKNLVLMTHRGTPMEEHVPPEWFDKIMHARMEVGNASLMASDAPPGRFKKPEGMSVSLQFTDLGEAERVFAAFADGGSISMPFGQTFWAKGFGMVTDRFGIPWILNCE